MGSEERGAAGNARHTPGPWTVIVERIPHTGLTLTYVTAADPAAAKDSGYRSVPFHIGYAGSADSAEREAANARLVSRAPCLLDVLERMVGATGAPDADLMDEARRLLGEVSR